MSTNNDPTISLGRGKGGKGLGLGEPIPNRAVKRLYEPPENPIQIYRTLDDGYYLESAKKKKKVNVGNDAADHRKRNDHEWLNTIVLRNVYEYLEFEDQLRFRLVNCGMNEELALWSDDELGERACPWYAFQVMLNFERFCREMKKEEASSMRSRKILYNLSGCLTRLQGEIRNAQVCSKHLLEDRVNPFKNYFIDGEDLNFEELVKNDEYVNLFKSGAVKYTEWVAGTLEYSEGSACEIRIKKKSNSSKSKPSYVYLYQANCVGMNGREGTMDESYYMLMREEGSNKTIPLMEYMFYRDPSGEGYTKKSKITKLIKTCELPSNWNYEQFISFMMLCSNSFLKRTNYENASLWERIKTCAVFSGNLLEDDEIEDDEEGERDEDDEEDEEDEEDEPMRLFNYEGDEINLEQEKSGKIFMDGLLSKCCHQNKSISQIYMDLVSLRRIVLDVCSKSNFGTDVSEDFLGYVEIIKSTILKTENSTGFFVTIGEYVTQSRSFTEATLQCENSKLIVEANLSDVQGYHSRSITFKLINQKDKSILIDFSQNDFERIATVDPQFKNQILGKDASSAIDDYTFVGLFGFLCMRVHTFLLTDERLVRCIDNDMCFTNPLLELLNENL